MYIYIRNTAFNNIVNHKKIYELRLKRGIFKNIKIGDIVTICNKELNKMVKKKIEDIIIFSNFENLFLKLGIKECIMDCHNIKDALKHMESIYNIESQKKYKCMAIKFKE